LLWSVTSTGAQAPRGARPHSASSAGGADPPVEIRRQRTAVAENDGLGLDAPHRRRQLEGDLVWRAQLPNVGVEHRRRFREQPLSRIGERHVHAAESVSTQDLAECLYALQTASDDHHPRRLAACSEPLEAPADAVALRDGLEGERVLDDTRNPPGRVHSAERHDQHLVAQVGAPTPHRDGAPDGIDPRDRIAYERVTRAPDGAVERQAQQLGCLHAGEELVDVGQELEPAAPIDEGDLVPVGAELERGGEAREAPAQDEYALAIGRPTLQGLSPGPMEGRFGAWGQGVESVPLRFDPCERRLADLPRG
jgi:hypothetical protein